MLLANATEWEGWIVGEEEMGRTFKAAGRVARHYPQHMSQRALDWGALTVALGSMCGTRVIGFSVELRRRRVAAGLVGQGGATVHHLRPVASSPPPPPGPAPVITPALDPGGDDGHDLAG